MAMLTKGEYGSEWRIKTGDENIDSEQGDQLKITDGELLTAINMENLTDVLFGRILKNRSKSHQSLMDMIPGAK